MRASALFPIIALAISMGSTLTWAEEEKVAPQSIQTATLTHASVTVRGNHSHSALVTGAPRSQVPAPIIRHSSERVHRPDDSRRRRHRGFHIHRAGCCWTAGSYQLQTRQIWVPGFWIKRYVPPRYEAHIVNGRRRSVLASNGYYADEFIQGHYELRDYSVWVPGRWGFGI